MSETIFNAGNTLIPAYLALQSMGYRVWWQRGDSAPDDETWFAEGELGHFIAEDPVSLLGLIAMREQRGITWHASDEQIAAFMDQYSPI